MKKKISAILLTTVTVLTLTGCGTKFTCDICEEEKTGKKHKTEVLGQEVVICNDCYKELEELGKELQNMLR